MRKLEDTCDNDDNVANNETELGTLCDECMRQYVADGLLDKEGKVIIRCPKCDRPIWDRANGSKLNKCWKCGLAFD